MVVSADVEDDREDPVGIDARAESVQRGFGSGDGDATDALVCGRRGVNQSTGLSVQGDLPPMPRIASESVTTIRSIASFALPESYATSAVRLISLRCDSS